MVKSLGFAPTGPITAARMVGDPLPDMFFLTVAAAGIVFYLAGVRRMRRAGHRWPAVRAAAGGVVDVRGAAEPEVHHDRGDRRGPARTGAGCRRARRRCTAARAGLLIGLVVAVVVVAGAAVYLWVSNRAPVGSGSLPRGRPFTGYRAPLIFVSVMHRTAGDSDV